MYTVDNLLEDIFDWQYSVSPEEKAESRVNMADNSLMILVSNIIFQLGVPVNVKGYAYLREAIITKINEPDVDLPITKSLYPSVAKKFDTSAVSVERAIRHAIEAAWDRANQSYRNKIFLHTFSYFDRRPTNSEFIAIIADRIMLFRNC